MLAADKIGDSKKVEWLIEEYELLKEEESKIFSFEFTVLSIWISFIGVLLSAVVKRYDTVTSSSDPMAVDLMLFFLVVIILPTSSSFFGILWLDLSYRFTREGHYLFILEKRIKKILPKEDIFCFEHYIMEDNSKSKMTKRLLPANYIFYCIVLALLVIVPIIVILLSFLFYQNLQVKYSTWGYSTFAIDEVLTVYFSAQYIREGLKYLRERKEEMARICTQEMPNE